MKKLNLFGIAVFASLAMFSCGSSKDMTVQSNIDKQKSLEGEKVVVETTKLQGIDMVEDLNEEGTKIIKIPFNIALITIYHQ